MLLSNCTCTSLKCNSILLNWQTCFLKKTILSGHPDQDHNAFYKYVVEYQFRHSKTLEMKNYRHCYADPWIKPDLLLVTRTQILKQKFLERCNSGSNSSSINNMKLPYGGKRNLDLLNHNATVVRL